MTLATTAQRLLRAAQNHVVLREVIASAHRISLALQLWHCNRQYIDLGRDMEVCAHAINDARLARIHLAIRAAKLRRELIRLGGAQ
jgi:hypothetical protein